MINQQRHDVETILFGWKLLQCSPSRLQIVLPLRASYLRRQVIHFLNTVMINIFWQYIAFLRTGDAGKGAKQIIGIAPPTGTTRRVTVAFLCPLVTASHVAVRG